MASLPLTESDCVTCLLYGVHNNMTHCIFYVTLILMSILWTEHIEILKVQSIIGKYISTLEY